MYIYMQAEFVTDYSPGYCPGLCLVRPPAYILFKNFYNNELSIVHCQFIWHGLQQWKIDN